MNVLQPYDTPNPVEHTPNKRLDLPELHKELKDGPVKLRTRTGFGEEISIGLKIDDNKPSHIEILEDSLGGEFVQTITSYAFIEGNDIYHDRNHKVLVAHRDLAVFKRSDNGDLILYTDYRTGDYFPPDVEDFESRQYYEQHFKGSNFTVERYRFAGDYRNHILNNMRQRKRKEEAEIIEGLSSKRDPYSVGLGQLVQAISLSTLDTENTPKLVFGLDLSQEAQTLWESFGAEINHDGTAAKLTIDTTKLEDTIINHVRFPEQQR